MLTSNYQDVPLYERCFNTTGDRGARAWSLQVQRPGMEARAGAELFACLKMGRSDENERHSEDSAQKER